MAIYKRKIYITMRSRAFFFSIMMPLIFAMIGVGISSYIESAYKNQFDREKLDKNEKAVMYFSKIYRIFYILYIILNLYFIIFDKQLFPL